MKTRQVAEMKKDEDRNKPIQTETQVQYVAWGLKCTNYPMPAGFTPCVQFRIGQTPATQWSGHGRMDRLTAVLKWNRTQDAS